MTFTTADAHRLLLGAHEQLHVDGAEIAKLHASGVSVTTLLSLYPCDLEAYVPTLARIFDEAEFAFEFQQIAAQVDDLTDDLAYSVLEDAGAAMDANFAAFTWTDGCDELMEKLAFANNIGHQQTAVMLNNAEQALRVLNRYLWLLSGWREPVGDDQLPSDWSERLKQVTLLDVHQRLLAPLLVQADARGVGEILL